MKSSVVVQRVLANFKRRVAAVEVEREVRIELEHLPEQVKEEADTLHILQNKLEEFPGGYIRVRKETPGGCTFTRKDFDKHHEDNIEISEELFEKLFKQGYSEQDKTRLRWQGWDIDLIGDDVVAEYELPDGQDSIQVPDIFVVKKISDNTSAFKTASGTSLRKA